MLDVFTALNIKVYLVTKGKEENKMRFIRFIAKHWIISLIVIAVLFGVVLPNVEASIVSMGSDLINSLLGGC